ncbi:Chitin synthase, class 7 [Entophlyctis luteolus]|nr:Chitin synthase, class 7 [Entophlyctis luteolus]KAJ3353716.1 Chitin synthase, class 7 [Entophlyctis luteolus]KAJ3392349.1 Chitin synthase, class 7 [Entophlyctis sp. JEL0112]
MSISTGLSTAVDGTLPPLSFGSFDYFCAQTALPLCSLVASASTPGGTEPLCYGRNIDFITSSGTSYLLFEPATVFTDIVVLSMALTMILYIRSKYTAVGRKEIVMFFYMYSVTILLDLLLVGGIIPPASDTYKYFTALHTGFFVSTFWTLMYNGIVGFQWTEDGTPASLWTLRLTTLAVFVTSFAVAILTFLNLGGLSSQAPTGLFILYFIFPAVFTLVYVCLQIILVVTTLDDRWPLSDLLFGLFFFAIGLVLQFVAAPQLCELATHYVDGMFFGQICTLLAVMLVYKFWDLITKEDLEFAVSGKASVWETRNPLLGDDDQDAVGVKNDLW